MSSNWNKWVRAEVRESLERLSAEIEKPPYLVVCPDFLHEDKAESLYAALTQHSRGEQVYAVNGRLGRVTREFFFATEESQRFYTHWECRGALPNHDIAPDYVRHLLFGELLQSEEALAWFSKLSGTRLIKLEALNGKRLRAGDYLRPHGDNLPGRGFCAVFYLCRNWKAEYGGQFQMFDGDKVIFEMEPGFNRLLLFRPHKESIHAISPFTAKANPSEKEVPERVNYSFWFTAETPETKA